MSVSILTPILTVDHTDPIFRSHFPTIDEEEEDMDFDSYDAEQHVSINDAWLEGMEEKERQEAAAYLSKIYATLGDEVLAAFFELLGFIAPIYAYTIGHRS